MLGPIGNYSLSFATLVAAVGLLAVVAAVRLNRPTLLSVGRWTLAIFALLMSVASAALMAALINSHFEFSYVVGYTERALPTGYKIAAFWAGQEGSLLLWAWLLAVMSLIAAMVYRGHNDRDTAAMLGTLLIVCGFFAVLMLFAASPFALSPEIPEDGRGLNPLLQDPGMIAHPPLLFIGYAGFTIPFAMMMGALVGGRKDNHWVLLTRRWTLVSWVFLSVGIMLGAQWAYVELGWGGYWAWDPVENASLLPWLTGTAVLHSIMVQSRRGMFKVWNAALIALTFMLCIFGTYLTRSGVVGSVHTFGENIVGNFFLTFLLLCLAASIAAIALRWRLLRPEAHLEAMISREGAFLAGNILLTIIMVTTLVGTIFPLLSEWIRGEPISLGPPFYNKIVVPMGMLLLGLMAMGPVLKPGKEAAERMARVMLAPSVLGVTAALIALTGGMTNIWALGCVAVVVAGASSLLIDFVSSMMLRIRNTRESFLVAAIRLFDGDHRRYGGQLTHVGMLMIAVGITGSSLYNVEKMLHMHPGDKAQVGRYTVQYVKLTQVEEVNFGAIEADMLVTGPDGETRTMRPQRRFYHKSSQPNTEVALETTLRDDLYLTLAGWEARGATATIQVIVNPLVAWMWIGTIVLSVGGIICILPRLLPQSLRQSVENQSHPTRQPATTAS